MTARVNWPRVLLLVILCCLAVVALCKKAKKSLLVTDFTAAEDNVDSRGLITDVASYRSILSEHGRHWSNTSHRHYTGNVLGYITPWNQKGYEMAIKFKHKFTHVSPVWYQLQSSMTLVGRGGVDKVWISNLRSGDYSPAIVPRIVLEGHEWNLILQSEKKMQQAINKIVDECRLMSFDGIVLEAWSAWTAMRILENGSLRSKALKFVAKLGEALRPIPLSTASKSHFSKLQFLFVIPPPSDQAHPSIFSRKDMEFLAPSVDGFSLMTYDFSNPGRPGPNSPLPWVRACLSLLLPRSDQLWGGDEYDGHGRELKSIDGERKASNAAKVLLGLNFYGNDFTLPSGGGPIIGHEYLSILDKYRPHLQWDSVQAEHLFKYGATPAHVVYFPTLKSIDVRIKEAREWGTGISIWELGQGLEYFYDLL